MIVIDKTTLIRTIANAAKDKLRSMYPSASGDILFDPQGRVLIDIKLTEEESTRLHQGMPPYPNTVTVSVDVYDADLGDLQKIFEDRYKVKYINDTNDTVAAPGIILLRDIKGSIISLQHEFHFHLALAARTYNKINPDKFPEDKINTAHAQAMKEVQPLIEQAFKNAAAAATTKDGSIDDVKLIQMLDKARKEIAAEAHSILIRNIYEQTGNMPDKAELAQIKHTAEKVTATPNDLLYIDPALEQYTWIAGSEKTAHERSETHLADRQILTIPIDASKSQRPAPLRIRTPSLDIKKGDAADDARSVCDKLGILVTQYTINQNSTQESPIRAFTYNLLTAFNDRADDLQNKNKQSYGADVLFRGAHLYNKSAVEKDSPLCLVQNISVNGFGDSLGYTSNSLRSEATLMAEMAMLYNLQDKDQDDREMQPLVEWYKDFIEKYPADGEYFSQSPQGKQAIVLITVAKERWANQVAVQPAEGIENIHVEQAKAALKVIIAHNLHHQHEYAKLVQSLSLFIEEAALVGCKSGNERTPAILGRVGYFSYEARQDNSKLFALVAAIAQDDGKDILVKATQLDEALEKNYDKHLHSADEMISFLDQGAPPKLGINKKNIPNVTQSRNNGESSRLKHLSQENAGALQAHKGLPKLMANAALSYAALLFKKAASLLVAVKSADSFTTPLESAQNVSTLQRDKFKLSKQLFVSGKKDYLTESDTNLEGMKNPAPSISTSLKK